MHEHASGRARQLRERELEIVDPTGPIVGAAIRHDNGIGQRRGRRAVEADEAKRGLVRVAKRADESERRRGRQLPAPKARHCRVDVTAAVCAERQQQKLRGALLVPCCLTRLHKRCAALEIVEETAGRDASAHQRKKQQETHL